MKNVLFAICAIALFFIGCDSFKADPFQQSIERLQQKCDGEGLLSWKACGEIEIVRGLKLSRTKFLELKDGECVPALSLIHI